MIHARRQQYIDMHTRKLRVVSEELLKKTKEQHEKWVKLDEHGDKRDQWHYLNCKAYELKSNVEKVAFTEAIFNLDWYTLHLEVERSNIQT